MNLISDTEFKELFEAINSNGYGASAKAITSNILDTNNKSSCVPYDFGDFERCYHLVESVEYLKANLFKMKEVSKAWQLIVENWEEYGFCIKQGDYRELNKSLNLLHEVAKIHDSY